MDYYSYTISKKEGHEEGVFEGWSQWVAVTEGKDPSRAALF